MDDLISRSAAIDALKRDEALVRAFGYQHAIDAVQALPSVQPTEASCWGCNCPKMEILKEQKTFSEMVHLHDAETHDKHTETHSCDYQRTETHGWIPVTERLPDKKTEVIYSLDNHFVSTGYMTDRDYNGDEMELHWEDMESGALIYPEAWMPLPEPYKGEQNEGDRR